MTKIKMQLFGSFKLDNGEVVLGEESLRSNKLICLLVYLLINRDRALTQHRLIDIFWAGDMKNPEGALKNLIYRLRNELKVLGDEKFIRTLPSAYWWNPEIEIESDYERFEKTASKLKKTEDIVRKEKLCREIIMLYRGNISAKVADEFWILPRVTFYQSIYKDAVKQLCRILEKEEKWEEIELICNQALNADFLDEDIHCLLITALHGQKKYDLALFQYEKAKQLLYENIGIQVPEKLQKTFQEIMSENREKMTDIGGFLEETKELETSVGGFFCDYQIFRQIYRMEIHRMERLGISEVIVLFTIRRSSNIRRMSGVDSGLVEGMDILKHCIEESLRAGDVATKYSMTQIIVLLPTCTYETGVRVAKRIQKNFQNNIGNKKLELGYELSELSAPR